MTISWEMVLVILVAILVGAAIPLLVQLRATLRVIDKTLRHSGARFDEAAGATAAAAGRIDALVARLEEGDRLGQFLDGVADATRVVNQLRDTLRIASAVGAAVGPAVAAAVHAFREDRAVSTPAPLRGVDVDAGAVSTEPRKRATP